MCGGRWLILFIDWRVAGGLVDSITSFNTFEAILGNATSLPTGYVDRMSELMSF
jgi:hypothetical protein